MPTPARRVPSFVAGVLAMSASLVALGAVIWSDIAQASQQPVSIEQTDELTVAPPVKLQKFKYEVVEEEEDDGFGELGRIDFGKFEGY
jgi:hypothetical protein